MTTTLVRKAVFRMLENLRHGALELVCPERTYLFGEAGAGPPACIVVKDERFFSRVLHGGEDAAGDAYADGDWSSPDLVAVVRLITRNLRKGKCPLHDGQPFIPSIAALDEAQHHRRQPPEHSCALRLE
jgi:hypothetical protein